MLLKEEKWESCKSCGTRTKIIQQQTYGCDNCKKVIDFNKDDVEYLEFSIFHNNEEAQRKVVCSWLCFSKLIKKLIRNKETDYFINLPFIQFGHKKVGTRAQDFLKILK